MFNLLVSGSGWADSHDTIPAERVFEYTDDLLQTRFKPRGKLDFEALMRLPTLFLEESSGIKKSQIARVGKLLGARVTGRHVSLDYVFDASIPAFSNSVLESFAGELGMSDFEFSRTHWAVKDVDLFEVLLRHVQPRRRKPRVFKVSEPEEIDANLVSVMMPFKPSFDEVFEAIKGAVKDSGLRCRRADDIWGDPTVIQDVVSLIDKSGVVICDCTERNPNVFYEIGIAHTLGRDVLLLAQSHEDMPFDLQHLRFLKYQNNAAGRADLRHKLAQKLSDL